MLRIPPPAIIPSHYPAVIGISVFIQLRDMRGTCRIGLQLHDPTDEVIWREIFPEEIVCPNPLGVHYHIVQKWPLRFPKPGHYVLGLILNGEEVSRHHWDLMRSPEK